jgi:hypothetical protein
MGCANDIGSANDIVTKVNILKQHQNTYIQSIFRYNGSNIKFFNQFSVP